MAAASSSRTRPASFFAPAPAGLDDAAPSCAHDADAVAVQAHTEACSRRGQRLEMRCSLTLGGAEARMKSCTVLCGSIVIGQPSVPLPRFRRRTHVRRSDVLLFCFVWQSNTKLSQNELLISFPFARQCGVHHTSKACSIPERTCGGAGESRTASSGSRCCMLAAIRSDSAV